MRLLINLWLSRWRAGMDAQMIETIVLVLGYLTARQSPAGNAQQLPGSSGRRRHTDPSKVVPGMWYMTPRIALIASVAAAVMHRAHSRSVIRVSSPSNR